MTTCELPINKNLCCPSAHSHRFWQKQSTLFAIKLTLCVDHIHKYCFKHKLWVCSKNFQIKSYSKNYWNNITQKEESALPCISALSGKAESNQAIEVPPTAARLQLWYWFFYIEVELVNGNLFNTSCSYYIYQLLFIIDKVYYKFKTYFTGFILTFFRLLKLIRWAKMVKLMNQCSGIFQNHLYFIVRCNIIICIRFIFTNRNLLKTSKVGNRQYTYRNK